MDCAAVASDISRLSCLQRLHMIDTDYNSFSSMARALQQLKALTHLWLSSASPVDSGHSNLVTVPDDAVEVLKSSLACMASLKQLCLVVSFSLGQLQGMSTVIRGLSPRAEVTLGYLMDEAMQVQQDKVREILAGWPDKSYLELL